MMADGGTRQPGTKKRRRRSRGLLFIEVICIIIVLVCIALIAEEASKYIIADNDFKEFAEETGGDVETASELNGDIVGWISVEDTRIDYPVCYTPDDPEYYLHRNTDREYSFAGTPFLGEGSNPDDPDTNSMIVYAHHMRDGSMFGQLKKFEDADFASAHTIEYTDADGTRSYRVLGAWHEDLTASDYYRYWDNVGALDEEEFEGFVDQVVSRSEYATGVDAAYGDELLILSTCSYHTDDERFVVVGVCSG